MNTSGLLQRKWGHEYYSWFHELTKIEFIAYIYILILNM